MIYWSFISFAVALTSGLFGFGGSASDAALLGQALFFVFLVVSVLLVAVKLARDHGGYGEMTGEADRVTPPARRNGAGLFRTTR